MPPIEEMSRGELSRWVRQLLGTVLVLMVEIRFDASRVLAHKKEENEVKSKTSCVCAHK